MDKLTFILIILATLVRPDYVYLDKIEERFATKTPYRLLANEDLNLGFYPGWSKYFALNVEISIIILFFTPQKVSSTSNY